MTTPKEVLAHLFENVLELDSADTAAFNKKGGVWNYKKLLALSYNNLTDLYKSDHITLAACRYATN